MAKLGFKPRHQSQSFSCYTAVPLEGCGPKGMQKFKGGIVPADDIAVGIATGES